MKLKLFKLIAVVISACTISVVGHSLASQSTEGSSFNEVWRVVTVAPQIDLSKLSPWRDLTAFAIADDEALYGTAERPTLPQYSSTLALLTTVAANELTQTLTNAARRTVTSPEDYHDYFEKLVHANGICFSGEWQIDEDSPYSGYFQKGSKALIIGRISAANPQTTNDKDRSFGFAGKIFPTTNPDQVVRTANFFTVHNLNGTAVNQALDVAYVNEPPVKLNLAMKLLNRIFEMADSHPGVRPLYPIARAGLTAGAEAKTPTWMRIRTAEGVQNPKVDDADFRNELSARNYPDGLEFTIEVSDSTKDPSATTGWQKIGHIRTSALVTTFGCDRRLHFHHAPFRDPEAKP